MQESFENEEEEQEHLRMENEIKKIKLSLEHGMDLSKSFSDPDLPPEVEGEFLDYIKQWEEQFALQKKIVIYDLLEKPAYIPVADLGEAQIKPELERVMEMLNKHSIAVDTLCDVEDRELYRFITEELFKEEMDDIRIDGMIHCFTYEEFHPNHEYDIKNRCEEILDHLFDNERDSNLVPWGLANNVVIGDNTLTKEALNEKICNFRDSFSSFTKNETEVVSVTLNEDNSKGEAIFHIDYTGCIDGSVETMQFNTRCTFYLQCEHEWWVIYKLSLPGILE